MEKRRIFLSNQPKQDKSNISGKSYFGVNEESQQDYAKLCVLELN